MEEIAPDFDDCPVFCIARNEPAFDYCANCDIGIAKANFEKNAKKLLIERMPGGEWQKFGFKYLYKMVLQTLELENVVAVEKRTVVFARLIHIINSERNRIRRIEKWNEKQNANNK